LGWSYPPNVEVGEDSRILPTESGRWPSLPRHDYWLFDSSDLWVGALRTRVVSAPTLAGQLDRLIGITGLSTLELGVIPFDAAMPVMPLSGFRLYDDLVIVEAIVGEQQLAEPDDVARYGK
jgi:hypothetical protein